MKEQELKSEHVKRITDYYDVAGPFYFRHWHRKSLGLHYGFWDRGVKNRFQAITYENEFLAKLGQEL